MVKFSYENPVKVFLWKSSEAIMQYEPQCFVVT